MKKATIQATSASTKKDAKAKGVTLLAGGSRRIEYLPVADLVPATRNPKAHADEAIDKSVGRFGFTEPIMLDERTGRLVAGHGRVASLRRLQERGDAPPDGVVLQGKGWLVPVVRGWASRSDQEADAYLLASNQLTVAGGWQIGELAKMLQELGSAADGLGWDNDELSKLLDSMAPSGPEEEDFIPAPSKTPWVQLGDMFELGEHRILCGSSTHPPDIDRLMGGEKARICWTDPPWNVALDTEASKGRPSRPDREIANDNLGEDFPQFCALYCGEIARVVEPGAPIYLAMSTSEWSTIDSALKLMGFHWSSTIVWAKDNFVVGRKDYHMQYEPVWYGWRDGAARLVELEDRTQSDLWTIPRPKRSDEHPTMKPVELVARSLKNSSRRGDLVFEPFSGSGTTLMACEQVGRRCRAVELEPRYVQVALERWEKSTGGKAVKVE